MTERDLNHEAVDYIFSQERELNEALRSDKLSSELRSQLEIEQLLVMGASIMTTFYFQERSVGELAVRLTRARIAAVSRLNPQAAELGILNVPVEEISISAVGEVEQPLERKEG